jgi:hypothetical protein
MMGLAYGNKRQRQRRSWCSAPRNFIPDVRELLWGTLASHELDALDFVLQPAQDKLRAFVEHRTGSTVRDFRALLADRWEANGCPLRPGRLVASYSLRRR